MASFADLTARLNLNIQGFSSNLQAASGMMNRFARNMNGTINTGMTAPAIVAGAAFKDVGRIVQGILISQVFYAGLRSIREATSAVWDFSSSLEYAQISYSNLFGDTALATEFINVLKDFAAVTPFSFTDAEKAARRLLAYGIQYKNVMYVMQGVLSASTMSGDAQTIESVSRALGQINTKGRLYNEEMRQLTEAGIPAYEILSEKLGLTNAQLKNLAKNAVPANVAINALVDGINERFGGVAAASSQTMKGLFSNLKDNLLMIGSDAIQPLFTKIKGLLVPFVDFATTVRNIIDTGGLGAVFQELVPPELQGTLRLFMANLMNLWRVIKENLVNVLVTFKAVLKAAMLVFNAFSPAIVIFLGVLSNVTRAIFGNERAMRFLIAALAAAAAMWVVFKLKAVAAAVVTSVITLIASAVGGLAKVLTLVVMHPFWALLIGLVGVVVGLSGGFNALSNSVNNYFKKLTQLGGVDPDSLMLPKTKERAADISKFNEALGDTSSGMDDLANSTSKAAKAAKGLLSFDEVFALKEASGGGSGGDSGLPDAADFAIPDFGGMGGITMPELPEVGSIATDFVDSLLSAFSGSEELLSAGIGSILGGVLGGLIGGPLGAKIGALAGAIAGWFWPEVAKALGLTDVGTVALPIATVLGAALGWLLGGPIGSLIGGAIGALVGWIIDKVAKGLETGDWTGIGKPIGVGIGTAIGFLVGGPLGALIGGSIGLLAGHVVDLLIDGFTNGNWDVSGIATGMGALIGGGIGLIMGGPAGAALGTAVGALSGWLIGLIVDNWDGIKKSIVDIGDGFKDAIAAIGEAFVAAGTSVGDFFSGVGTAVTQAYEGAVASITGLGTTIGASFTEALSSLSAWFTGVSSGLSDALTAVWESVSGFFVNLATRVAQWSEGTFGPLINAFHNLFTLLSQIMSDILSGVITVLSDVSGAVITVATALFKAISEIFGFLKDLIAKYVGILWSTIAGFLDRALSGILKALSAIWNVITGFLEDTLKSVLTALSSIWDALSGWLASVWSGLSTWLSTVLSSLVTFFKDLSGKILTFLSDSWSSISEWLGKVWAAISEQLANTLNNFITWAAQVISAVATFFTLLLTKVSEVFTSIITSLLKFFSDAWTTLSNWFVKLLGSIAKFFSDILTKLTGFGTAAVTAYTLFLEKLWTAVKEGTAKIYKTFKDWVADLWDNVFGKFFGWLSDGMTKLRAFFQLNDKASNYSIPSSRSTTYVPRKGHAVGGIFNREHVARFAENNKAEAIIPLENGKAMQPFVDAVSNGLYATLAPMMSAFSGNTSQQPQPIYVGTLIADDASLRELNKRMQVINLQETTRRAY